MILGGGSPKNFYLQAQPTLWEVYGIQKGGNEYFIQFTTDQVVWGGLSGATPSEAVSWGKVNPGVLPDTVVAYVDSTIAFPLFCEYAVGSPFGRRPRRNLVARRRRAAGDLARRGDGGGQSRPAVGEIESIGDLAEGRPGRRPAGGNALCGAGGARRSPDRPADLCRRQHAGRHHRVHARDAAAGTSCSSSSTTTCGVRPIGGISCLPGSWDARW